MLEVDNGRAIQPDEAWASFCDGLKEIRKLMLAPDLSAAPIDRAEGWRYLSRLIRVALEMMVEFADSDFPVFYSASHETIKIGGDNPDNLYLNAAIRGDRTYCISGTRGTVPLLNFGTKANRLATSGTMESTGELDARQIQFAKDGSFELYLSSKPLSGNWLSMAADSTMLIVRQTFMDRSTETPAKMTIRCLDGPAHPSPLNALQLGKALMNAATFVSGATRTFLDWMRLFRQTSNQFPVLDQSIFQRVAGSPDIYYYHGYWDIAPDEALIIHSEVPACSYWSFVLQNPWMESLDYRYFPVSINARNAHYNSDGSVTVVVTGAKQEISNRIDVAGHDHGTMLWRWVNADHYPQPQCRVVKLSDINHVKIGREKLAS